MKKRGVSPVIATIILVGIVIVLGIIVFIWLRSFVKESNFKFGQNIQLSCPNVGFDTNYDSNGNLQIVNSGSKNVPIYSFNLQIDKSEGGYVTRNIAEVADWPSTGLPVGNSFSGNISDVINGVSGAKDILVIPILKGTLSSGDLQTYACDSQYGKKIIL